MALVFPLFVLLLGAIACSSGEVAPEPAPRAVPPAAVAPAAPAAKLPPPEAPALPRGLHDPAIAPLLSRLAYKPDPYATQPGCISEPKSQLRDELVLWVELALTRDAQNRVAVKHTDYSVTTATAPPRDETAESLGIPQLELVYADRHRTHSDFEGAYRELQSSQVQRTADATPRDPTWVLSWLASAPMSADVTAHRIVLDGRVLQEVKRPDDLPRLGSIECDDTSTDGLKLSWHASSKQPSAPLLVEVLRYEAGSFLPLLPGADARQVQGFTLQPTDRSSTAKDLVLLVTLTDTFRFVTRGVLVPKKAL